MGTVEENNANAPTAFGLAVAAGMATCIGAVIVFSKRLVKLASKRFLAGSLGIAAGVMLYVSLVDLFVEAQSFFVDDGCSDEDAYLYATLSLFGGILIYKGLDYVVHILEGGTGSHHVDIDLYDLDGSSSKTGKSGVDAAASGGVSGGSAVAQNTSHDHDVVVELTSGTTVQPSADLHTMNLRMAGKVQNQHQGEKSPVSAFTPDNSSGPAAVRDEDAVAVEGGNGDVADGAAQEKDMDEKLVRMGIMTALAIGIHNIPEGLATFVATLSDPSVGAAVAVAIAIHNIPEGLCVAIPVYYGTGNRWKAFGWALLSGVSEPIGAGLGWLILKDVMSELVYGILFGVVAGMMVNITIQELIPTAVRYDPTDRVTTNSIIIGMAVMALSLVLFQY